MCMQVLHLLPSPMWHTLLPSAGHALPASPARTLTRVACAVQMASHGLTAYAGLEYYDPKLNQPYAMYHALYLGVAKDYVKWVEQRLNSGEDKEGRPLPGAFQNAALTKSLVRARLRHFVLRSVSRCRVVDFTQHVKQMTIAEMQLLFEVGLPYIMHDWLRLGVPEVVVLWGCG